MLRKLWNWILKGLRVLTRIVAATPVVATVTVVAGVPAGAVTAAATIVNGFIHYRARNGECWAINAQQISWTAYLGLIGILLVSGDIFYAILFGLFLALWQWATDLWIDKEMLRQWRKAEAK